MLVRPLVVLLGVGGTGDPGTLNCLHGSTCGLLDVSRCRRLICCRRPWAPGFESAATVGSQSVVAVGRRRVVVVAQSQQEEEAVAVDDVLSELVSRGQLPNEGSRSRLSASRH